MTALFNFWFSPIWFHKNNEKCSEQSNKQVGSNSDYNVDGKEVRVQQTSSFNSSNISMKELIWQKDGRYYHTCKRYHIFSCISRPF